MDGLEWPEPEDSEPDDGEPDDGEPDDGGPDDGEPEEEICLEGTYTLKCGGAPVISDLRYLSAVMDGSAGADDWQIIKVPAHGENAYMLVLRILSANPLFWSRCSH